MATLADGELQEGASEEMSNTTRREFNARMAALAAGTALASAPAKARAAENRPPNVLLLFSDQHNATALGCMGHPLVQTPSLDALAKRGTLFRRAYCQDGICVPSRTSMLTGLYPRTTGCLDNPNNPVHPERYPLLHHLLRGQGYLTGCFGKRHLPTNSMSMGWDRSATTINPKLDPSDENYREWIEKRGQLEAYNRDFGGSKSDDLMCHISSLKEENRLDAYAAAKSIEFLQQAKEAGKPFFCWTSMHFPHQPYTPAPRWAERYPVDKMPLPGNVNQPVEQLPPLLQNWRRQTKPPWNCGKAAQEPDLYKRYIAYYYALTSEVDHCCGLVLKELERLGLADNTLVIYAADHGDFVAHHGMVEKCALGHNVYEDTLRVPIIVSWPKRLAQGQVRDDLVELLDLYPTVQELVGLERPNGAEVPPLAGRSLVPTLTKGEAVGRRYAFSENWSQTTVIGERHKLGVWIDPTRTHERHDVRGKCPDLLFDRESDPLEVSNLAGESNAATVEKELRAELKAWAERTPSHGKEAIVAAFKPESLPAKGGKK